MTSWPTAMLIEVPSRLGLPPMQLYYAVPEDPRAQKAGNEIFPRTQAREIAGQRGWKVAAQAFTTKYSGPLLQLPGPATDPLEDEVPCLYALTTQVAA
jgi:hypothetical protein